MELLPLGFEEKMKSLLGKEFDLFIKSYEKDRVSGLRLNRTKTDRREFLQKAPFTLTPVPWAPDGFFYGGKEGDGKDRPGKHPYHDAGVYYIQEPSAMAAAEFLDVKPGDVVLDLCAAPGGKTTHILSGLMGSGMLVTNEIHPARAKILSQNVERMGTANTVVLNEDSSRLVKWFPEFFDKIIVDAPCSGEGMFRKDENARCEWSPDHVKLCAVRQQEILENAAMMLKPGGRMVYSTCTFSPEENEGTVDCFLKSHPDFSLIPAGGYEGFSHGCPQWIEGGEFSLKAAVRIWPHRMDGEGHFMAVLERENGSEGKKKEIGPAFVRDKKILKVFFDFCWETLKEEKKWESLDRYLLFGEQLYLVPEKMLDFSGLRVLRPGLHLGCVRKNRFEPSHALALFLKKEDVRLSLSLEGSRPEILRYLKGETLEVQNTGDGCEKQDVKEQVALLSKGWVLICVDGYSIGWGKQSQGIIKNHYPKGLRWL